MKTYTLIASVCLCLLINRVADAKSIRFPKPFKSAAMTVYAPIESVSYTRRSPKLKNDKWLGKSKYYYYNLKGRNNPKDHILKFRVGGAGYLILGFDFKQIAGNKVVSKKASTPESLKKAGWLPVGTVIQKRSIWKNKKEIRVDEVEHQMFINHVKQHRTYEFFSNKKHAPIMFTPDKELVHKLLKSVLEKEGSDDLSLIVNWGPEEFAKTVSYPDGIMAVSCQEPDHILMKKYGGALTRELVRQAWIIAARDELGLATRDDSLLEVDRRQKKLGDNPEAHILTYFENDKQIDTLRTIIYQYNRRGRNTTVLFKETQEFPDPKKSPLAIKKKMITVRFWKVIQYAERLSRGKFVRAIKRGQPKTTKKFVLKPFRNDGVVPEEIEKQLDQWDWLSQYSALRSLHKEIEAEGESPQLLGAIVRAYANLGSLTEYYSYPASKVFKARALLYAQRMRIKTKTSPFSQYHWAYAFALTGLDLNGQSVFELIKKQPAAAGSPAIWSKRPPWAETLSYFCSYNSKELKYLGGEENSQQKMARYFLLLASENSQFVLTRQEAATNMLAVQPNCLRALDNIRTIYVLGTPHIAFRGINQYLQGPLFKQLRKVPDIPLELEKVLDSYLIKYQNVKRADENSPFSDDSSPSMEETIQHYAQLLSWLEDPKNTTVDKQDPSLAMLHQMLKETLFQHAWYIAKYQKNMQGIDASDTVMRYKPVCDKHRFFYVFMRFSNDKGFHKRTYREFHKNYRPELSNWATYLRFGKNEPSVYMLGEVIQHTDNIRKDLFAVMFSGNRYNIIDGYYLSLAERMLRITQSPQAMVLSVEVGMNTSGAYLELLRKKYPDYPDVQKLLAIRYLKAKNYPLAQKAYEQLTKLVPEEKTYMMLADFHKIRGDKKQWRTVLDKYLKETQSFGLDHARVNEIIANDLMDDNHYNEALPYAKASAESASYFGCSVANRCYEGLQKWEEAEKMVEFTTGRYDRPVEWFFWCTRTGHGDLAASKAFAINQFQTGKQDIKKIGDFNRIVYYSLIEDQAKLKEELKPYLTSRKRWIPRFTLMAASLMWEMDDEKSRDIFLKLAAENAKVTDIPPKSKRPQAATGKKDPIAARNQMKANQIFAAILKEKMKLKKTDKKKFDLSPFHKLILISPTKAPTTMFYHLGVYLDKNGKEQQAVKYFQWAATGPCRCFTVTNIQAAKWLTDHNQKINTRRKVELTESMKKELSKK